MSRTEDFDNGFWDEPDLEHLSGAATLLYIWSWTNPRCDWAGIYRISKSKLAGSKCPPDRIDAALAELEAVGWVFYREGVLWVRGRVSRIRAKSPRMAKSVAKDWAKTGPQHPLGAMWLERYGTHAWLRSELAGVLDNLQKGSTGVQTIPVSIVNSDNPSNTSLQPHLGLQGRGQGPGIGEDGLSEEKRTPRRATRAVDQSKAPDELPAKVADRLDPVLATLARIQALRGGGVPTVRGVGLALTAFPARDHLAVASDLEHWATVGAGRAKPVADWVGTYRTFLKNSADADPVRTLSPTAPRVGSADVEAKLAEHRARAAGAAGGDVIEGRAA